MKKHLLFKSLLLLCALVVGSGSVWAQTTVKDDLTASDFAATSTTYTDFSGVSKTSDAVYAGNSAKDSNGNIQLRSKNSNSGIVSTTSGGTVKSVKITVGSGSNSIDVYGSNTAYSNASDLYGNNKGTKIGSLTATGTITFPAETDYEYVGIRSYSGAIYLSKIEITWETSSGSGNSDPSISATPTSLSTFTYVEGNGPSAAQTISVSGSNLTHDIVVAVDDDYEISTSQNSGYSDEVTLNASEGTVSATNVYVRLKAELAKGSHDGIIIISSEDANDVEIDLSGSVTGEAHTVTVATGLTGGEIEADPTSAEEGAEVTLSATPSSGYRLSAWDVYKTGDATTKVTVSNDKFTMPDYAVTVSATFELIPSHTYSLATSVVPGRHYIITSGKTGTVRAMGYQDTSNRKTVSVDVQNGTITVAGDAGVYEFLVGVEQLEIEYVNKGYYFTIYDETKDKEGYLYAASSGSNHLKTQGSSDENSEWAITIDEDGVASIVAKQSLNRNVMQYNSSNTLFSCYATASQSPVYLFERNDDTGTQDFTVSINAACTDDKGNYYATFSAPFAFTVPSGVTVSEIGINNEGKLDIQKYADDAVIPANTGVMISSTTSGDKTFISAKGGTSVKGSNNRLRPACWEVTAKEMGDADKNCLFYRLTMHNGSEIGFWWGAADGAAFDLAANKAYLYVKASGLTTMQQR